MTLSNMIKSNLRRYGRRMLFSFPDGTSRRAFAMRWRPGQKNFTAIVGGYTELGQQDNDLYYLLCPPCEGQKSLQKGCVVTDKGEQFQVLYLETREVGCEIYFLFAVLKKIYGEESA